MCVCVFVMMASEAPTAVVLVYENIYYKDYRLCHYRLYVL